jgi:hypothetical protein
VHHAALIDVEVDQQQPWWERCQLAGWSEPLLVDLPQRWSELDRGVHGGIEKSGRTWGIVWDAERGRTRWPAREAALVNRLTRRLVEQGRAISTGDAPCEWFAVRGIRTLIEAQVVMAIVGECWSGNPCGAVRAIEVLEGRGDPALAGLNPEFGYPDNLAREAWMVA